MKYAVYSGTRNLYNDMETAAKSLFANSSVDKVFFLIEDEAFPRVLPSCIECLDVSGQKWFPANGVNMNTQFTYMAMIRVCYPEILPKEVDRVLQLDVDTVCVDDIDPLFETDLGNTKLAMVDEKYGFYSKVPKPFGKQKYFNAGVLLLDLKSIRDIGIMGTMVNWLNHTKTPYIDQDAMNWMAGDVTVLPLRWNESMPTGYTDDPAIVHFAGYKQWYDTNAAPRQEYWKKYADMTWDEVMALHALRKKGT